MSLQHVIERERKGDYLGKTVQVVPHITDAIQDWIEDVAKVPVDGKEGSPDVCVIELGGTVGDIESSPFVEGLRQGIKSLPICGCPPSESTTTVPRLPVAMLQLYPATAMLLLGLCTDSIYASMLLRKAGSMQLAGVQLHHDFKCFNTDDIPMFNKEGVQLLGAPRPIHPQLHAAACKDCMLLTKSVSQLPIPLLR